MNENRALRESNCVKPWAVRQLAQNSCIASIVLDCFDVNLYWTLIDIAWHFYCTLPKGLTNAMVYSSRNIFEEFGSRLCTFLIGLLMASGFVEGLESPPQLVSILSIRRIPIVLRFCWKNNLKIHHFRVKEPGRLQQWFHKTVFRFLLQKVGLKGSKSDIFKDL